MLRTLILCAASALTLTACDARAPKEPTPTEAVPVEADPADDAAPSAVDAAPDREGGRRGARGPQTREQFQERIERGFAGLDGDGDGVVTAEELNGASGGRAAPMMARLDEDEDGTVTRAEMAAGAERLFARMDADGDGVISPDERPQRGGRGGPE